MHEPVNLEELRQTVVELRRVRVAGSRTKPAMSVDANVSTRRLSAVVGYDPGEFTFTAQAGAPLKTIQSMLAEHGQFLAFDPVLVDAGATLGGAVSAGVSGPGRLRFGGVRDFLLGAQLVTGEGRIVFGGGKVVKNAAGFDIPKLLVGSQGKYGVLAELTFKVFPQVESYATLQVKAGSLDAALEIQAAVAASPLEPFCIDLLPPSALLIRVGGLRAAQAARIDRLLRLCRQAGAMGIETLSAEEETAAWAQARELTWAEELPWLLRIATTSSDIPALDASLETLGARRRYSGAGNSAWIACPDSVHRDDLESVCQKVGGVGVVLRGAAAVLGDPPGEGFRRRLRSVFDPQSKFSAVG